MISIRWVDRPQRRRLLPAERGHAADLPGPRRLGRRLPDRQHGGLDAVVREGLDRSRARLKKSAMSLGVVLQPLTIKYCQDDLLIFRVKLVAAMRYVHSFTDQTPHSSCHGEAENHFPRSATPTNKNPILSSEMDLGLRSATPMLTQRHQHRCTRRAALKFSIGGRKPIQAIFCCEGWFPLGPDFMMCPGCLLSRCTSDLFSRRVVSVLLMSASYECQRPTNVNVLLMSASYVLRNVSVFLLSASYQQLLTNVSYSLMSASY